MQGKTLITIVLDETSSMNARRDATISGFNEFINSQKDKALGECRVTLIQFNSEKGVQTKYSDVPVDDVPELTSKGYQPAGNTPLYDALAQGIHDTEHDFDKANDVLGRLTGKQTVAATPMVIVLVLTDGEENSSKQYSRKQIFQMVNDRKQKGWSFVFLGADMDSWASASVIGYAVNNVRSFVGGQSVQAFAATARNLTSHRVAYSTAVKLDNLAKVAQSISSASTDFYKQPDDVLTDNTNNLTPPKKIIQKTPNKFGKKS